MTHEQFIKSETAQLAKKAGFDWGCQNFYEEGDDRLYTPAIIAMEDYNWNGLDKTYSAPTQAVLQRWLREVKNIQIWSEYHILITGGVWLVYYGEYSCKTVDLDYLDGFPTHEEAIEAGLQKCLKKIIENR